MEFNEQQLEAIESTHPAILCLAGAGAGKTSVMVARIHRLVNVVGVDPKTILALTFTNAAAFEMRGRYKKLQSSTNPSMTCPEFKTFHSFCYNIIIRNKEVRTILGYSKVPEICEGSKFKRLKKELLLKLGLKLSEKEIEDGVVYGPEKNRQLELFNKALKKELREQNLITFDIMCYNVGELFVNDDASIQEYKHRYKYIFLDEAQDTDAKQFKFVSSFGKDTQFFLLADILQCIYQFRGCTNEYVKTLAEAPTWKLIKLYKNYRSTEEICTFANRFSHYAKENYRIEMEGQRSGDPVEVITGAYSGFERSVDARHLSKLVKMLKANPVESAILCRSNREVNEVADSLQSAGIEFYRSSKESDAVNLLNSALDNNYMMEWLSTWLEGVQYADYIRLSSIEKNPDVKWFAAKYGQQPKIQKRIEKVVKIRKLISDLSVPVEDRIEKIKQLLKIKTSKEFDIYDGMSSRQIIETLRDKLVEIEENKIYLGTIHSSKGLEYERVYVMGVDDKLFRLGDEEMNNLYYVAITRAKNHLTVFRK